MPIVLILLLLPLVFAWRDRFCTAEQQAWRKILSTLGLLLVTSVPILSLVAMVEVNRAGGISPNVIHTERWMFAAAALSIPLLCFGYRMTRWLGVGSAIVLPFVASFIDTLY